MTLRRFSLELLTNESTTRVPGTNTASPVIATIVEELGGTVYYDDDYTGDKPPADLGAASYLLGHDPESAFLGCLDPDPDKEESSIFPEGSVVIDPWRKCPDIPGCTVVHYGNTRLKK